MKKQLACLYSLIITAMVLFGCMSGPSTPTAKPDTPSLTVTQAITIPATAVPTRRPTITTTQPPTPMGIPPTFTHTPLPTQTATRTPPPTLEPTQAEDAIRELLRESSDCHAPCFWGITPGETTIQEARNIFSHLGLFPKLVTSENEKYYYEVTHTLNSGLAFSIGLAVQDDVVKNLRLRISPEKHTSSHTPKEWQAYSPETIINQYGLPSKIHFYLSREPAADLGPNPWYVMVMYFDEVDLIIQYGGGQIGSVGLFEACPLTDQFDTAQIWLGKNPEYPPGEAAPLEEATSLTMEEFAKLMISNPENACFELNGGLFP